MSPDRKTREVLKTRTTTVNVDHGLFGSSGTMQVHETHAERHFGHGAYGSTAYLGGSSYTERLSGFPENTDTSEYQNKKKFRDVSASLGHDRPKHSDAATVEIENDSMTVHFPIQVKALAKIIGENPTLKHIKIEHLVPENRGYYYKYNLDDFRELSNAILGCKGLLSLKIDVSELDSKQRSVLNVNNHPNKPRVTCTFDKGKNHLFR